MNPEYHFFYYAAVVAVIVRTMTDEEIARDLRTLLHDCCDNESRPYWLRKLSFIFLCEFCFSFWVSLVLLVGVFGYRILYDDWRGYLVSVFTTMAVANVYMSAFSLLRVGLRKERAVADRVQESDNGHTNPLLQGRATIP